MRKEGGIFRARTMTVESDITYFNGLMSLQHIGLLWMGFNQTFVVLDSITHVNCYFTLFIFR